MSNLYSKITTFYRTNWEKLSIIDLAFLCSAIATSITTGRLEMRHFDGYCDRRQTLEPIDRFDASDALQQVSAVLAERLRTLSPSEIAVLDRQQRMFRGVSDQIISTPPKQPVQE